MEDDLIPEPEPTDGVALTANAAEFLLPNGVVMVGIFHVRCSCQETSSLAAPINLLTMVAVCRFCNAVYKVSEFSLRAAIEVSVPAAATSAMTN